MKLVLLGIAELFLIICSIFDFRKGEIPAWVLYAGIIAVLVLKAVMTVSVPYIFTAAIIYTVVSVLQEYTEKWIGGADTDALFVIWLALGVWRGIQFLFITSALGCIILTPLVLLGKVGRDERIPLIPLITLGFTVTCILEGCGV